MLTQEQYDKRKQVVDKYTSNPSLVHGMPKNILEKYNKIVNEVSEYEKAQTPNNFNPQTASSMQDYSNQIREQAVMDYEEKTGTKLVPKAPYKNEFMEAPGKTYKNVEEFTKTIRDPKREKLEKLKEERPNYANFLAGTQQFGGGIVKAFEHDLPDNILPTWQSNIKKVLKEHDQYLAETILKPEPGQETDIIKLLGNKDWKGAYRESKKQALLSAPSSFSAMALTLAGAPVAAGVVIGAPAYGSKQYELDDIPEEQMSQGMKDANALLTAISEAGSEVLGDVATLGLTKVGKVTGLNKIKNKLVSNIVTRTIKSLGGGLTSSAMEGLEEGANSIAQNLIDKLTGYDPNRELMDNVAQSFVLGATSSMYMQSPVYGVNAGLHVNNEANLSKQNKRMDFKSNLDQQGITPPDVQIPDVTPKKFTKGFDTNDQAQMSNVEQETNVEQTKDTTEKKKPSENLPTKEETEQLIEKHLGKKKETSKTENKEETKAPEKEKPEVKEDKVKTMLFSMHETPKKETEEKAVVFNNKGEAKILNTRGMGTQFHGTSNKINNLSNFTFTDQNIMGSGFYTTDAFDVSVGYAKKGSGDSPAVYMVDEKKPLKLYDMNKTFSKEDKKTIRNILKYSEYSELIDKSENMYDLYSNIRDESSRNNTPAIDVQETFLAISETLEDLGFSGYKHVGGKITNNKDHTVKIYWNPQNDLYISKFNGNIKKKESVDLKSNLGETKKADLPSENLGNTSEYIGKTIQAIDKDKWVDVGKITSIDKEKVTIYNKNAPKGYEEISIDKNDFNRFIKDGLYRKRQRNKIDERFKKNTVVLGESKDNTSPTEQEKSEAEQTSINPTQKTAGESSAPGGEKVKTNPYLKMPIERVKEDAKSGVELAKKALRERKGEVDPALIKAKEKLEKKLNEVKGKISDSDKNDIPGTYVTGSSGVSSKRKEKLNQQLDKRIDRAVEATKLEKRLDHVNKKIESQEKAPQDELIKIKVQEKLNERFDSIDVGDKIDVGGNNLLTVTKKNRKSVITQGGSKWSANEIGKVIKNKAEAKQQEQQKQKPDTKKIQKLRKTAQAMDKQIDAKLNPAVAQQNPTARRASMASSMEAEGRKLQKVQRTLNELAQMHEDGSIPEHLKNISTKAEVETIIRDASTKERGYDYRNHGWIRKNRFQQLIESIKGKKGAVEVREELYNMATGKYDTRNIETMKQASAIEKALKLAGDKLDSWDTKEIRESVREAKRYFNIGAKDKATYDKILDDLSNMVSDKPEDIKKRKLKEAERSLIGRKIPGFFPTPKSVINKMLEQADIKEGMDVLEPSAGKGDIADAIQEDSGVKPDVIEIVPSLSELLQMKGYKAVDYDFISHKGKKKYDRIVMNPPFEKNQDIEHVKKAYELLKPGGRLVSIMGEGAFFRTTKTETEFREWLEEVDGYSEKLPDKSFTGKDAFRQTGTATRMVVIEKQEQAEPKATDSVDKEYAKEQQKIKDDLKDYGKELDKKYTIKRNKEGQLRIVDDPLKVSATEYKDKHNRAMEAVENELRALEKASKFGENNFYQRKALEKDITHLNNEIDEHRKYVETAIHLGKDVSKEALSEYPELQGIKPLIYEAREGDSDKQTVENLSKEIGNYIKYTKSPHYQENKHGDYVTFKTGDTVYVIRKEHARDLAKNLKKHFSGYAAKVRKSSWDPSRSRDGSANMYSNFNNTKKYPSGEAVSFYMPRIRTRKKFRAEPYKNDKTGESYKDIGSRDAYYGDNKHIYYDPVKAKKAEKQTSGMYIDRIYQQARPTSTKVTIGGAWKAGNMEETYVHLKGENGVDYHIKEHLLAEMFDALDGKYKNKEHNFTPENMLELQVGANGSYLFFLEKLTEKVAGMAGLDKNANIPFKKVQDDNLVYLHAGINLVKASKMLLETFNDKYNSPDDFGVWVEKQVTKNYGEKNKGLMLANRLAHKMTNFIKKEKINIERQGAILDAIEKDSYDHLNLSENEMALVEFWKDTFKQLYEYANAEGVLDSAIENYVPHKYKDNKDNNLREQTGSLNPNTMHALHRKLESREFARSLGYETIDDMAGLVHGWVSSVSKAIADKKLIENLKNADSGHLFSEIKKKDYVELDEPALIKWYYQGEIEGTDVRGFDGVDKEHQKKIFIVESKTKHGARATDGKKVIKYFDTKEQAEYHANKLTENSKDGKEYGVVSKNIPAQMFMKPTSLYVNKAYVAPLQMLASPYRDSWKITKNYVKLANIHKKLLLFNPIFHGVSLQSDLLTEHSFNIMKSMSHFLSDKNIIKDEEARYEMLMEMAENGVMLTDALEIRHDIESYMEEVVPELTHSDKAKKLLKKAGIPLEISDKILWKWAQNAQMSVYMLHKQRYLKKGFNNEQAGRMAAHFVNDQIGSLPRQVFGKNSAKILNFTLFARNWTVSNLRYVTGALGYRGDFARFLSHKGLSQAEMKAMQVEYTKHLAKNMMGLFAGKLLLEGALYFAVKAIADSDDEEDKYKYDDSFFDRFSSLDYWKHPFDVRTPFFNKRGGRIYFISPLYKTSRDLFKMAKNPASAFISKMAVIPKYVTEMGTNTILWNGDNITVDDMNSQEKFQAHYRHLRDTMTPYGMWGEKIDLQRTTFEKMLPFIGSHAISGVSGGDSAIRIKEYRAKKAIKVDKVDEKIDKALQNGDLLDAIVTMRENNRYKDERSAERRLLRYVMPVTTLWESMGIVDRVELLKSFNEKELEDFKISIKKEKQAKKEFDKEWEKVLPDIRAYLNKPRKKEK